jgi:ferric-dicitrate binding protein FerR (iron transport regulator)
MSSESAPTNTPPAPKVDAYAILAKAARRAGEGGLAGAAAMAINVCSLMWIRTAINYQYR